MPKVRLYQLIIERLNGELRKDYPWGVKKALQERIRYHEHNLEFEKRKKNLVISR